MSVLNVKDRVTEYRKRFKLKDTETGQEKTYDLEQVTGEITELGTPINKALFDKVENVLSYQVPQLSVSDDTLIHEITSDITCRADETETQLKNQTYTGVCIGNEDGKQITVSYNISSLGVSSEQEWTPERLNSIFNLTTNTSTGDRISLYPSNFVRIDLAEIRREVKVNIMIGTNTSFRVSENGETWTAVSVTVGNVKNISLENIRYMEVTGAKSSTTGTLDVFNFSITENVPTTRNDFVLENNISFEEGQRVLLHTPTDVNTKDVLRNFLNNIEIKDILQPNQKYELVYEDGVFNIFWNSGIIYDITTEIDGVQRINLSGIMNKLKANKLYVIHLKGKVNLQSTETSAQLYFGTMPLTSATKSTNKNVLILTQSITGNWEGEMAIVKGGTSGETGNEGTVNEAEYIELKQSTKTSSFQAGFRIVITEVC